MTIIETSQDLSAAIAAGSVVSDAAASVFAVAKPIDVDAALIGLAVVAFPGGWLHGAPVAATLTGRSCFSYSGRGAAQEMTLADGRTGWITDWRAADPAAFELITNERRSSWFTACEPGQTMKEFHRWERFMGVRVPRSVRFIDARSESPNSSIVQIATRPYDTFQTTTHYSDSKDLRWASESRNLMERTRSNVANMIRAYRRARRDAARLRRFKDRGGSVVAMPALIVWQNFGVAIMTSTRDKIVVPFEPLRTRKRRAAQGNR